MVVTLESEQKLHLLRVIDELDAENRDLLQQVMELQDAQSTQHEGATAAAGSSKFEEEQDRRIGTLRQRNRELLDQLHRLQAYHAVSGYSTQGSRELLDNQRLTGTSPATDDDDDIDLDEISAFLDKEESSDEQQLSDAVLGIESAFADARQAQFKTLVRQHRDPLLNDLLRHSQALRDGLHCVAADIESAMAREGEIPDEHVTVRRPKLPKLNRDQRRSVWGNKVSVVEEQEQFRNKPMPRDSIHRHSRIVRKGRARLTAQLKRLSVYTADSSLMNDSTSTDDLLARRSLRRRGSSRHSFPAGVQSGTGTSATPQGMDLASTTTLKTPEVKSAAMLTQQGSGITLSGLSGSSTTEQEARVLTLVDDPIVGDGSPPPPPPPDADVGGARGTTPRVFQAQTRRQQRTSSQSSLGSAAATEGKEGSSSSTTTMGTLVFGTPVAAASSASSSSAAPGGRSRVHTAAVVGARDSMELQQPPAQDEKKEVHDATQRVHDVPHSIPRELSRERVQQAEVLFKEHMRNVKDAFENAVGIPLVRVNDDNIQRTLLRHFADGHLLCVLANIKLRARNLDTIKPYCAHGHEQLSRPKILANFSSLMNSCQSLGMLRRDVPTPTDFQELSAELKLHVGDRVKHNKILNALETLLSLQTGSSPVRATF